MEPSGLQLFAVNNVDLHVWGITVAPQWIQNINTVVIVIGGPLLAAAFSRLRGRGWRIDIPTQFAASLLLMGVGFLARSEEHTSELQSLMRISYAVFCLKKKITQTYTNDELKNTHTPNPLI